MREECSAGDIVACVDSKALLVTPFVTKNPIILGCISFADPVIDVAGGPDQKAGRRRCPSAFKLAEGDPTFQVHTDHETGQTIIVWASFT